MKNVVAVMLPDKIDIGKIGKIKLQKLLSMRVFEWLVILVECKIYEIKESEASESKKPFVGWLSL